MHKKTKVVCIKIVKDDEAQVYFATSEDIGLALEADSLDDLMKEIRAALPELPELGF